MPPVVAAIGWGGIIAAAGVAVSAGAAVDSSHKQKKAAKTAREANEQAMKDAKAKAADMKEASAKRSNMFNDDKVSDQKSLLTAQKAKRRAISGSQGTRLTGGKLGSPVTTGGATLLGQ